MSYLSHALNELMTEAGIRNVELSRKTKIDQPTISRWRRGEQVSINDEHLQAIAKALTPDPRKQAKLVVARMRDVCYGPGAELVEIRLAGQTLREEPIHYGTKLPPQLERAFEIIRGNVNHDDDLRDILIALANLFDKPNENQKPKPK